MPQEVIHPLRKVPESELALGRVSAPVFYFAFTLFFCCAIGLERFFINKNKG
jgi:hypothetical protein